jgi:predicted kinase
MPTLTVLMGPPGSGKTTWAAANAADQVLCSTDRMRTDRGLTDAGVVAYLAALSLKAERALSIGCDVVVDACNTRRSERSRWLGVAHKHRARARLIVVHAPLQTLLDVQRDRTHAVAQPTMRGYLAQMRESLPRLRWEGWDEIVHVEPGDLPRRWVSDDAP